MSPFRSEIDTPRKNFNFKKGEEEAFEGVVKFINIFDHPGEGSENPLGQHTIQCLRVLRINLGGG